MKANSRIPPDRRSRAVRDEPRAPERVHDVLVDTDRGRPEAAPDDGTAPQRVAGDGFEQVDPGSDHAVDGIRDRGVSQPRGRDPASVPALEHALVDEHVQHLLEEERVALGVGEHAISHLVRNLRLAEERGDELGGLRRGKRRQRERRRVQLARAPGRARLQQLQPGGADEQDARARELLGEPLDQVEHRAGGPVDVLHGDDRDLLLAECLEVAGPAVLEPAHRLPRIGVHHRRPGKREPDRPGRRVEDALGVLVGHRRLDR